MDRNCKISKIFTKTVQSVKRQISLAFSKHTASCWRYYLGFDYKYQGCESVEFTKKKLICIYRSKSLNNIHPNLQLKQVKKTKSCECIRSKHDFYVQFDNLYDIEYNFVCNY